MNDDPLAYFLTWTTYGTWLPGDERWWISKGEGEQAPDAHQREVATQLMTETSFTLSSVQREIVEATIHKHCDRRKWHVHALNCRTNHVHVVVTALVPPKTVAIQLKAWCTRRLKEHAAAHDSSDRKRENWWTEGESRRQLFNDASLDAAIRYVLEGQ